MNEQLFKLEPNTLPLSFIATPSAVAIQEVVAPAKSMMTPIPTDIAAIDDRFPKGRIVKYFKEQRYGFIMDQHQKEVFFSLEEMDILGGKKESHVKVGQFVGYDVSRTSRGLRIKRMKIY